MTDTTPADELRAARDRLTQPGARILVTPRLIQPLADWLAAEAFTWAGDEMHSQCSPTTCTLDAALTVARVLAGQTPQDTPAAALRGPCPGFPDTCPNPVPGDEAPLRGRYAAAIRDAACDGNCELTEAECAQHRIQPVVWHHGTVAEVSGTPEMLADAALTVRDHELEQLRAKVKALEEAVQRTAADALRHRGCHMKLMAQCQRAEHAEAAFDRVRAVRNKWLRNTLEPGQVRRLLDDLTDALNQPTQEN